MGVTVAAQRSGTNPMRLLAAFALTLALAGAASAQTAHPAAPHAPAHPVAPAKPTAAPAASPAAAARKVDINAATEQQLETLPGVGAVRGKAIVAHRPYEELDDLVKKKVLTKAVLDGARAQMALANVNTSTAKDMEKTLPGVGEVRSKAIVAGRPYATLEDLVKKDVLTAAALDKIRPVAAY